MLDTDTKRRIDTARDILVGKVPDPKSQVEQITIALIYKFMDDMDAESEEFGGVRKFFAGEFARYGWAKLMRSGLGGHETLNLYAEAIAKMPENPGIPLLFRDIFKNAYLPYRDPETLRAFLKIIDEFNYDHSEKLGDAFEYLLSVLGSQGDAGQFRTPRHIIDFMVAVIDPKKNDKVLDPACGTAGFLISAYKHILANNRINMDGQDGQDKSYSSMTTLTPEEKGKLAQNFIGYDISPDMVRLSLVNMYLHGFTDPHIYEYDTLTSQERWKDYADVILANPPFMSPKGGIIPHKRFSVQSKRSEVLFVDYMAEHLTTNGRAAIIVPEGIIFQSGTAYKQLRQLLVDKYLVAVVSLPAGVFLPYSGVKTSIIILDASLAKKTNDIAFFKVDNDGFGLGAQRRESDKNDLPRVLEAITNYKQQISSGTTVTTTSLGIPDSQCVIVTKEKIATNGDYNLSGERYREIDVRESSFPIVDLGSVVDFSGGYAFKSTDMTIDPINDTYRPVVKIGNVGRDGRINLTDVQYHAFTNNLANVALYSGDIVIAMTGATVGKVAEIDRNELLLNQRVGVIRAKLTVIQKYILVLLQRSEFYDYCQTTSGGGAQGNISPREILKYQIPLPPIEVQKEIVAEIEGYQKVIDGARAVVDNYRPHISVDADWPVACFKDAPLEMIDGDRGSNYPTKEDYSPSGYCLFLNTKNVRPDGFNFSEVEFISEEKDKLLRKGKLKRGDVVLTTRGTIGNTGLYNESVEYEHIRINSGMLIFRPEIYSLSSSYLFHFFQSINFISQREAIASGSAQPQLPVRSLNEMTIPIPPINIQNDIVFEIEAEQKLVNANKELIERMEKKIQGVLARVWGEGK